MKKLINLLKGSTFVLALCGLLSIACFSFEKKATRTDAVNNALPNVDNYAYYEYLNGLNYYWDGTFLAYDNLSSSSSSNQSSFRNNLRQLNQQPTNIQGLYYNFDESFTFGSTFGYFYADFYSYCDANGDSIAEFTLFDAIFFNGSEFLYRIKSNGGLPNIYSGYTGIWVCPEARNILFVTNYTGTPFVSFLYNHGTFYQFYEVEDLINQITNLNSQITTLESEISDLESDVSELESEIAVLESQISDLESQVSDLESQVTTLTNQLRNAYLNARRDTYVVDIKCFYNLKCDAYINLENGFDYYIVPKKLKVTSSLEVSDASGRAIDSHYGVVDEIDLSNLTRYYYNPVDLNTLLFVELNDNWLLDIPYYDNGDYQYADLENINFYLQDWVLTYKSDISFTSQNVFRSMTYDYLFLSAEFLNSYESNYTQGYYVGYADGYNSGRVDGFAQGESYGYNEGLGQDTAVASIFSGILQVALVPVNFFLAIFNFEILGINLSGFIRALFTVAITVIILRVVLGGKGSDS